jgi:hypothetical protein
MGKLRGKYKPKDENIRKLIAFLRKEERTKQTEHAELSKK